MQGSSLSDSTVIAILNDKFVPLYADVDQYGFPEAIPALHKYKKMWKFFEDRKWGIATSAVVAPGGQRILGDSGSGFFWQWKSATNYDSDKFLAYLQKALNKPHA